MTSRVSFASQNEEQFDDILQKHQYYLVNIQMSRSARQDVINRSQITYYPNNETQSIMLSNLPNQ